MSDKEYLSVAEFSELSGLSIATVWRYVHQGLLLSKQVARRHRVLIPRSALEKLSAETSRTPSAAARTDDTAPRRTRLSGRKPDWMKD